MARAVGEAADAEDGVAGFDGAGDGVEAEGTAGFELGNEADAVDWGAAYCGKGVQAGRGGGDGGG